MGTVRINHPTDLVFMSQSKPADTTLSLNDLSKWFPTISSIRPGEWAEEEYKLDSGEKDLIYVIRAYREKDVEEFEYTIHVLVEDDIGFESKEIWSVGVTMELVFRVAPLSFFNKQEA